MVAVVHSASVDNLTGCLHIGRQENLFSKFKGFFLETISWTKEIIESGLASFTWNAWTSSSLLPCLLLLPFSVFCRLWRRLRHTGATRRSGDTLRPRCKSLRGEMGPSLCQMESSASSLPVHLPGLLPNWGQDTSGVSCHGQQHPMRGREVGVSVLSPAGKARADEPDYGGGTRDSSWQERVHHGCAQSAKSWRDWGHLDF